MAVSYPHESLIDSHVDGCTEGWVAEIVASLLKARGANGGPLYVVELGGFTGTTSAWLALTLQSIGGGTLIISEPDPDRAVLIDERLGQLDLKNVYYSTRRIPSPQIIHTLGDKSIDFAWIDNDHSKHHVEHEIVNLWGKMAPGGIMCFHDVSSDGVCQLGPLIRKYGGVALDLPRLGPDGGLGIIQIPNV